MQIDLHFPASITIWEQRFLLHPILEMLGMFLGMRLYFFQKKRVKNPISFYTSLMVLIGATLGALLGSKIIGNLEQPDLLFNSDFDFFRFWTQNTIVGGLAFGLLGVEMVKYCIGHKESTGDFMVLPLILAMCIGRVGCFLTGIYEATVGLPTDWPSGMDLGDGILRHPVTLYEIALLLVLAVWLQPNIWKKKWINGLAFQYFMVAYFTFRFLLDFIKPRVPIFCELSAIQWTCILVLLYYIYLSVQRKIKTLV